MTTQLTPAKGLDPRYLTEGAGASGHAGGTRYYTEAAGEPPGVWTGQGATVLGLAGEVDPDVGPDRRGGAGRMGGAHHRA